MYRGFATFLIKFLLFLSAVHYLGADLATLDSKYEREKINAKLEDLQERLIDFQNKYLTNVRRVDGTTDFYRGWEDYQRGFGDMNGNFWIGLDKLHALTSDPNNPQELWIQVKENVTAYARYSRFVIGNEFEKYELKQLGDFVGTAGDSLRLHHGMQFTTKDYDNDDDKTGNCAHQRHGAWWYQHCVHSNLNGIFGDDWNGIYWVHFRTTKSIAYAHMAIKPARKR